MKLSKGTLAVTAIAVELLAYARFGRAWVRNWGARPEEATMPMPGDDILTNASLQTTRAITIDAPPEHVWPWLVQMGAWPRGGVYTYDWIQRLLGLPMQNTDRILPQFQHLEAGEYLALQKGKGIVVKEADPGQALVLQWVPSGSTWTFELRPDGANTRLLSRNRLEGYGPEFWLVAAIMEPLSLIMERKMLLGIKQRAEKHSREIAARPLVAAGTETWLERGAD